MSSRHRRCNLRLLFTFFGVHNLILLTRSVQHRLFYPSRPNLTNLQRANNWDPWLGSAIVPKYFFLHDRVENSELNYRPLFELSFTPRNERERRWTLRAWLMQERENHRRPKERANKKLLRSSKSILQHSDFGATRNGQSENLLNSNSAKSPVSRTLSLQIWILGHRKRRIRLG